jgi:hypothetical protein
VLAFAALSAVLLLTGSAAEAQSVTPQQTSVTLWAGTLDFNTYGLASLTAPSAGVILQGSAISSITGRPVRHLWYGDSSNGLCRVDPEMDQIVAPVAGIGGHVNVIQTCIGAIQATLFKPGQVSFDEATNTMYSVNTSGTGAAVVRLHYIPTGDNGNGTLDRFMSRPSWGRRSATTAPAAARW